MGSGYNHFTIIGNLTTDPVLGTDKDGACCHFTVAVNRIGNDKADFVHCKAKGAQAENLHKYKHKGDEIAVSGPFLSYEKEGEKIGDWNVVRWVLAAYNIHYCHGEASRPRDEAAKAPPADPPANQGGQASGGYRRRR